MYQLFVSRNIIIKNYKNVQLSGTWNKDYIESTQTKIILTRKIILRPKITFHENPMNS